MIRVLIIEDSVFMRTLVKDLLEQEPGLEVVGTASDGKQGLEKIIELEPDVITLDIEMPRMNGLELLQALKALERRPRVLMLSSLTLEGAQETKKAMDLGADDFMLKPRDIARARNIGRELVAKIRVLMETSLPSARLEERQEPAERAVLIGSSAGGPPMLEVIISSLREGLDSAVIVTQHMPRGFTALLAERLRRISMHPVKETENGETLRKGTIYISRAGFHTVLAGCIEGGEKKAGKVIHTTTPPMHGVRPAADITFTSAARVYGSGTLSILLSGMGNDGGEGMFRVKGAGGRTIVCREEDCLVYGMARSALEKGCVDAILPLDRIGDEILRFSREGSRIHA